MCLQTTSKDVEAGRRGDGVWQVVPDTGCGGIERPVADRRVTCPRNDEGHGWRRAQPLSGIDVLHTLKLVGEVWRSRTVQAAESEHTQFKVDPLWNAEPVEFS